MKVHRIDVNENGTCKLINNLWDFFSENPKEIQFCTFE